MKSQQQPTDRNNGQGAENGNRSVRMRRAVFAAAVAAVAVVATTVVLIGGSEPAHACLLPGIPC